VFECVSVCVSVCVFLFIYAVFVLAWASYYHDH